MYPKSHPLYAYSKFHCEFGLNERGDGAISCGHQLPDHEFNPITQKLECKVCTKCEGWYLYETYSGTREAILKWIEEQVKACVPPDAIIRGQFIFPSEEVMEEVVKGEEDWSKYFHGKIGPTVVQVEAHWHAKISPTGELVNLSAGEAGTACLGCGTTDDAMGMEEFWYCVSCWGKIYKGRHMTTVCGGGPGGKGKVEVEFDKLPVQMKQKLEREGRVPNPTEIPPEVNATLRKLRMEIAERKLELVAKCEMCGKPEQGCMCKAFGGPFISTNHETPNILELTPPVAPVKSVAKLFPRLFK